MLTVPALATDLPSWLLQFTTAHAHDQVVWVGSLAPGEQRHLRSVLPAFATLGSGRGDLHPGDGPQALQDLLGSFGPRPLYVLAGNGRDPGQVAKCLYLLPRGEGAVLVPLGLPAGPRAAADLRDQLYLWDPRHRARTVTIGDRRFLLVQPRRAVHVTFVMERYSTTYGTSGPSINWDNLVGSLQQADVATCSTVLHDERVHEGRPITAADLAPPPDCEAHLLVCTYDFGRGGNPPLALLRQAQARGSRVVYVWLDSRILPHDPAWPELADLNVVLDATRFDLPRSWPSFTPKNPAWFFDPGPDGERPIDVSVLGEMRFLRQRQDLVPRLQAEQRLRIHAPGSSATDPARRLSCAEYARVYQQSRLSVVLTKDRVRQLKGRIFEVPLCGALLLCDANPYVDRFFAPFREYVPFADYEQLIDACRHYLAHEDERRAIAAAGSRKANRCYTARVFWDALFARVLPPETGDPS